MKPLPRCLPVVLLLVLLAQLAVAQINVFPGISFSQPPWRDREGGSEPVPIDTRTPLPDLIRRLNQEWHFVATGRGPGYTDDMYSIAAHGEEAIAPLLEVAQHAPLKQAREGAVYYLHLIGVDSQADELSEHFSSRPARQALRSLLLDAELQATVMQLLLRDPWQSDVPVLLAALAQATPQNYVLTTAITHYRLADLPIGQPIPRSIGSQPLRLLEPTWDTRAPSGGHAQARAALLAIRKLRPARITIEPGLEDQPVETHLSNNDFIMSNQPGYCVRTFLLELTGNGFMSGFRLGSGTALQYYVDDKGVTVCSTATARQRVLAWWQAQPAAYRQQLSADKAK